MIGICDYGLGNVHSFANIYKKLNVPIKFINKPEDLKNIQKVILPGVGSYDHALHKFRKTSYFDLLNSLVTNNSIYILGVCVGMQMMGQSSEEGKSKGLNWLPLKVKKFQSNDNFKYPTPHMGWNKINVVKKHPVFFGIDQEDFYFLHSYYCVTDEKRTEHIISNYQNNFCSGVVNKKLIATQFHPEKSHKFGVMLLENFSKL
ncbi:imidazole glycerol phosphate synthase subunit HisH [Verrucomicrobia bacterium]|nr:imidazole glycerol phosphate synthase subunit HisH [Verrucomicrobiota bacterium]